MKSQKIQKATGLFLSVAVFLSSCVLNAMAATEKAPGSAGDSKINVVLNDTLSQLAVTVPEPNFGTSSGEWTVLSLARSEYYPIDSEYFAGYYERIVETMDTLADEAEKLDQTKSSENSRLIIALSAIGKPADQVGRHNLLSPFDDFSWITKQGINGAVYALIALDSNHYQTKDSTIRQQCIDYLLNKQLDNGGWALFGKSADPDITAMTLQALAPYTNDFTVAEAVKKGFDALSSIQKENGGFGSWGSTNSESIAQVIVACTAHGINPHTDARFIKNGNSAVDALLTFYNEDTKDFSHVIGYGGNGIATDQATYALVSYQRLLDGKTPLYDMSDVFLEIAKTKAKTELDAFAALKNPEDYRPQQQAELKEAVAKGKAGIDAAPDQNGIQAALSQTKKALNAVKTDAELTAEEERDALALAKVNAQKELDSYKTITDYRPAQQVELQKAIEVGKTAIENAKDLQAVNFALAAAKSAMDAIKTDAQLTEEEEANKPAPNPKEITLTDVNGTGISVTGKGNFLTEQMELEANLLASGEKYDQVKDALEDGNFVLYDLYLLENNLEIQPEGSLTLSIPVPQGYQGTACSAYYLEPDGGLTQVEAALQDGVLKLNTQNMGVYAVWQPTAILPDTPDEDAGDTNQPGHNIGANGDLTANSNPSTGELVGVALWIPALFGSLTALAVCAKKKKHQND